jgi:hypothetical protein
VVMAGTGFVVAVLCSGRVVLLLCLICFKQDSLCIGQAAQLHVLWHAVLQHVGTPWFPGVAVRCLSLRKASMHV